VRNVTLYTTAISNDFGRSLQAEDEGVNEQTYTWIFAFGSVLKTLNQAPLFSNKKGGGHLIYGP
jgi:hypothetical protein